MKAYISIGNSDDKLSQKKWRQFLGDVRSECYTFAQEIQGIWFSEPVSPFQNACFCVELHDDNVEEFKDTLRRLAHIYGQDSVTFDEVPTTVLLVPSKDRAGITT